VGPLTQKPLRVGPVDVDVAARPFAGEEECGDDYCAVEKTSGVLVAVVDGLGHGPEAAHAARLACETLAGAPDGEPVTYLVERCHAALRRTRGAAACVAFFPRREERVEWVAVGNVDGVILRAAGARRDAVIQRPGIVGNTLPRLQSSTLPFGRGDALVLATDGVDRGFAGRIDTTEPAEGLLERLATGTDDALLLLARYSGDEP